ncbi:hypothetical protein BOX15_Mlig008918g2, partial [Macrostomum lignano]
QKMTSPTQPRQHQHQHLNGSRRRRRLTSTSADKMQSVLQLDGAPECRVFTAGRPPWFGADGGAVRQSFVIGLCGASASGKTTVARSIIERLRQRWVSLLSMDSYYRDATPEETHLIESNNFNFDHPCAFDIELLVETLARLKQGKQVRVPVYDFASNARVPDNTQIIYGANVVIFEGILAFCDKRLLDLIDLKVFVDTDEDECLARRLLRDISERGRSVASVLESYEKFVKPSFDEFIAPTRCKADIIVPRGGHNQVAIDLICRHVRNQLVLRGVSTRSQLAEAYGDIFQKPERLPSSVRILPQTQQVRHLLTLLRNRDTARDEFVFYSNRLMRLLFEYAMAELPEKAWAPVEVQLPDGSAYKGLRRLDPILVGVSILRAGETMEPALAAVAKDARLGKILIQTNRDTGEPELHYLRLPPGTSEAQVLLMDATVASGAAAMMAIRVLLDHDCQEENITFCCLLASAAGLAAVAYAFPGVRLVAAAVDPVLSSACRIQPGLGNFGDRYFGTDSTASGLSGDDGAGEETDDCSECETAVVCE